MTAPGCQRCDSQNSALTIGIIVGAIVCALVYTIPLLAFGVFEGGFANKSRLSVGDYTAVYYRETENNRRYLLIEKGSRDYEFRKVPSDVLIEGTPCSCKFTVRADGYVYDFRQKE